MCYSALPTILSTASSNYCRGMSSQPPKLPVRSFFNPSTIICDNQDLTMHTTMSDREQLLGKPCFLVAVGRMKVQLRNRLIIPTTSQFG